MEGLFRNATGFAEAAGALAGGDPTRLSRPNSPLAGFRGA